MKIGVIFFSKTDMTAMLAVSLIDGLKYTGEATVVFHRITDNEIIEGRFENEELLQSLSRCDAIVFGTSTYMGGVGELFVWNNDFT